MQALCGNSTTCTADVAATTFPLFADDLSNANHASFIAASSNVLRHGALRPATVCQQGTGQLIINAYNTALLADDPVHQSSVPRTCRRLAAPMGTGAHPPFAATIQGGTLQGRLRLRPGARSTDCARSSSGSTATRDRSSPSSSRRRGCRPGHLERDGGELTSGSWPSVLPVLAMLHERLQCWRDAVSLGVLLTASMQLRRRPSSWTWPPARDEHGCSTTPGARTAARSAYNLGSLWSCRFTSSCNAGDDRPRARRQAQARGGAHGDGCLVDKVAQQIQSRAWHPPPSNTPRSSPRPRRSGRTRTRRPRPKRKRSSTRP